MITLQFVPYSEIEALTSIGRIRKLLKIARENKIVVLEGRLKKEEETELIKTTMEEIDDEFKGIEMAVILSQSKEEDVFKKFRNQFFNIILGNRQGFTVIGPASIIKEIKKDPNKIQLFAEDSKKGQRKKKFK